MQLPWIWLPLFGPIRISTLVVSLVVALALLWRRRTPLIAFVAVMAWLASYEILYQATGLVLHGWNASYLVWMSAAVGGWIVLGMVLGVVPDWRVLLPFALVWLVWILLGFNSNSPTVAGTLGFPATFSVADEILNELSKSLLALAYLAGALHPTARARA